MALTETQQFQYWQILKDSPLVKRWPEFRTQLLPRLEARTYAPGDFIFHRGDPPAYLYIVAAGRVVMQLQEAGETWFEQAFLPGEFFGQQILFDDSYRAAARASLHTGQVSVLLMHASDLQIALERAPALREDFLHEDRAVRLRRIPLFRTLEDSQLRWLAQLAEERSLAAGETLDLPQYPGVWIVDMGQMALKGAIHPAPRDWDAWRQAGSRSPDTDAVVRRARRWLYHRYTLYGNAARVGGIERRGTGGRSGQRCIDSGNSSGRRSHWRC